MKPRAAANDLTKLLQAIPGFNPYPLKIRELVEGLINVRYPNEKIEVVEKRLVSIEGALLATDSPRSKWIILVNSDIRDDGRQNFTLAHELGHYLLHRRLQAKFECGQTDLDSYPSDDVGNLETEANEFASQLLLPPNVVRPFTETEPFSIDVLRKIAGATGSSLTAAAVAYTNVTRHPVGFALVRDGFVLWGRASDAGRRRGVWFNKGREVPSNSRLSQELDSHEEFEPLADVGVWGQRWGEEALCLESAFFSARYSSAIVCLDVRNGSLS